MGRTVTTTDKAGLTTTYTYYDDGALKEINDPLDYKLTYTYDKNGNVLTETDKRRNSSTNTYNELNQLTLVVNTSGKKTQYQYDNNGNLTSIIDANENKTTYTYDELNRQVATTTALGNVETTTYNALGNVATHTINSANSATLKLTYSYDNAGNLVTETYPDNSKYTYTYDNNGNVTSKLDRNGNLLSYSYNELNQLVETTSSDYTYTYSYDSVGNMIEASDHLGTTTFVYDDLYQVITVTDHNGLTVKYDYDINGNRTGVTTPEGLKTTYVYDDGNRITAVIDHDGVGVYYNLDNNGNVIKETHADGSTTELSYDNSNLLILIEESSNAIEEARKIRLGYDNVGNLETEICTNVDIDKSAEMMFYTYDKDYNLVETITNGVSVYYTYDSAGNLLTDGSTKYTYNSLNQLTTKTESGIVYSYTYDKMGNLVKESSSKGTKTYEYDSNNRLVFGTNADGETSEYVYNALGARVTNIQITNNQNRKYTNSLFAVGSERIGDYDRFLILDLSQNTITSSVGTTHQKDTETLTKEYVVDYLSLANRDLFVEDEMIQTRYVYGPNNERITAEFNYTEETAVGEVGYNVASEKAVSIGKIFFRFSLLDTTLFAVDSENNIMVHAMYDEWGEPLTETKEDMNFYGFDNIHNYTGYTYDETLEIYFAQNRFYDPTMRRFTQEDPIKDGTNWYGYVGNNPLTRVDWEGLYYIYLDGNLYKIRKPTTYEKAKNIFISSNPKDTVGGTSYNSLSDALINVANSAIASAALKAIGALEILGETALKKIGFVSNVLSTLKGLSDNVDIDSADTLLFYLIYDVLGSVPTSRYKVDFINRTYDAQLYAISAKSILFDVFYDKKSIYALGKTVTEQGNSYVNSLKNVVKSDAEYKKYFKVLHCDVIASVEKSIRDRDIIPSYVSVQINAEDYLAYETAYVLAQECKIIYNMIQNDFKSFF